MTKDERFGQVKGNTTVSNTYSWGLVGQIKQNEKSAQIEFPITDETEGSVPGQVKTIIEQCARTYLQKAFDMDAVIDDLSKHGQFIVMLVIIIHYTIMV